MKRLTLRAGFTYLWLAAATASLTGCVTAKFDLIPGMVYDSAGRPVNGATVRLGDTTIATSDVNGRFSLSCAPAVLAGEAQYRIGKEGYESQALPLGPDSAPTEGTALYVKLESRDDLLDAAWTAIHDKLYPEARSALDRAASVETPGADWAVTNLALLVLDPEVSAAEARVFLMALRAGDYGTVPPAWLEPFDVD